MPKSPLAPESLPELHPVRGITIATAASNSTYKNRDDLMLMAADQNTTIAGVTTQSKTRSAAVDWCNKIIKNGTARAVLVNAGNANAFTGIKGQKAINAIAQKTAETLNTTPKNILLASTGVIGEPLDDEAITLCLAELKSHLNNAATQWHNAAKAIMTTDTFPKAASKQIKIDNQVITITGIAKGSGMIAPDMATMLAFIATDADITPNDLQDCTLKATAQSFNAITVDGDTSTSDTVLVLATAQCGGRLLGAALATFQDALTDLMIDLAKQIVRDGEGAQKFITIKINGAENNKAARRIGLAVANSPLVKTAIAGEDANWGRIVMAVGKSGEKADRDRLNIAIGGVMIARNGTRVENYDETPINKHMKSRNITIDIDLGVGTGQAEIWTCDLTHGYIDINAAYRS